MVCIRGSLDMCGVVSLQGCGIINGILVENGLVSEGVKLNSRGILYWWL